MVGNKSEKMTRLEASGDALAYFKELGWRLCLVVIDMLLVRLGCFMTVPFSLQQLSNQQEVLSSLATWRTFTAAV